VTQQEAALAPPDVVELFARTFPDDSLLLLLTDRAEELAQAYVADGILTAKYIDDARHVVIATTQRTVSGSSSVGTSSISPTTSENRVLIASIPCTVIPLCGSSVRQSLFMETKTKTFDAVAESRKWKESVGRATEGMTREEVLAYFDPKAVHHRFQQALERSRQQQASERS
jgi:hypothetical protein